MRAGGSPFGRTKIRGTVTGPTQARKTLKPWPESSAYTLPATPLVPRNGASRGNARPTWVLEPGDSNLSASAYQKVRSLSLA
jgi:hypothetical protein